MHRGYVGPLQRWDLVTGHVFSVLFDRGLRGTHKLLDIGCGCLRIGRLLIPYLEKGCYFGFEPNEEVLDAGITKEIGMLYMTKRAKCLAGYSSIPEKWLNLEFNFILAQSIFTHSPVELIKKYIQDASKCLADDGIFMATFILGKKIHEGKEWVYPDCTKYPREFIEMIAFKNGLEVLEPIGRELEHPGKHKWIIFRKTKA